MSQRIVAEYGGDIEVTSARDSGTRVIVRFPAVAREAGRPAEKVQ